MGEQSSTWTVTIECIVFAGDMSKEEVISNAQSLAETLHDGTDFISTSVIDAVRDEI